jgi:hypothetical protein
MILGDDLMDKKHSEKKETKTTIIAATLTLEIKKEEKKGSHIFYIVFHILYVLRYIYVHTFI